MTLKYFVDTNQPVSKQIWDTCWWWQIICNMNRAPNQSRERAGNKKMLNGCKKCCFCDKLASSCASSCGVRLPSASSSWEHTTAAVSSHLRITFSLRWWTSSSVLRCRSLQMNTRTLCLGSWHYIILKVVLPTQVAASLPLSFPNMEPPFARLVGQTMDGW